ncbi:MAG: V-type ATP synthase subunit C [Methanocellales archaeon]|nr:V-type ATP synthase subunit C [Methanocellales archaeon]MDD3292223.1 V-type ATP synthase subunit C [Methanocellales archaeon]MDD5234791.1 V-type ATP synthase subunit C [Methanocellales archaeon]MDD5484839.1 V-type ATP synthase subunit C [Methanocellales archaeon]
MEAKAVSKYAYSVGRVRALETKLLDGDKIEKMIEAEDAEAVLRILSETEYGDMIAEAKSAEEFEETLYRELKRKYAIAKRFYPDPELVDLFTLKYDFHNLKVLLKSKLSDQRAEMIDLGAIADVVPELMKEDLAEIPKKLPEGYARAIERVLNEFNISKDPQVIDAGLDVEMFNLMFEFASKSEFLLKLLQMHVDLANIKMLIRSKKLGKSKKFLGYALLERGSLPKDVLLKIYDGTLDAMVSELCKSEYGEIIAAGAEHYKKEGSLLWFEKLFDDFITERVKKAKYITFGLEPLAGYIIAKENEVKLIRTILIGKLNEIPSEQIKKMVREGYV